MMSCGPSSNSRSAWPWWAKRIFLKTLDAVYRHTDEIATLAEAVRDDLQQGEVDLEQLSAEESSPDAPVLKLLQTMFNDAIKARASDIHIEPGENVLRIHCGSTGFCSSRSSMAPRRQRAGDAPETDVRTRHRREAAASGRTFHDPRSGRRRRRTSGDDADHPRRVGGHALLSQSATLLSLEKLGMTAATEVRFRRLVERNAACCW